MDDDDQDLKDDEGLDSASADGSDDQGSGANDDGSDDGDGSNPKTYDEAYVKKLRSEAATYRRRAVDAEGKVKVHEDAQLSEKDRAEKAAADADARATAAEARVRTALAKASVTAAAAKAGAVDTDTVYALVQGDVTFDDDGEPENVASLVDALLTDKPFLKATSDGAAGSGGSSGNGRRSSGPLTAAKLRAMTAAEVSELDPKEVDAALARP